MKKISPDQTTSIAKLVFEGKSSNKISAILGLSHATVVNYRKMMVKEAPKLKNGRLQTLSARDKREIAL